MKYVEIIISRKEWSEKDDLKVWLFYLLQKGEIPSSPKYIKEMYDALVKVKKETKGMRFHEVRIETPAAPLNEDEAMHGCLHNCDSVIAHVLGHNCNNIVEGKDEDLHFIFEFRDEDTEKVDAPPKAIYLVMNRPGLNAGFPVAAFLTLLQAQQYMVSTHIAGWPKGVKGLGIYEMKLVSEAPVRYAWGDAMLPGVRKNKKERSLLEQGAINLLENEEQVEKDTKGEEK